MKQKFWPELGAREKPAGMRRTFVIQFEKCRLCPREVRQLRRGLCMGCYLRDSRGTHPGEGASCVCGVSNPIALVKSRHGEVRCYNCRALERAAVA